MSFLSTGKQHIEGSGEHGGSGTFRPGYPSRCALFSFPCLIYTAAIVVQALSCFQKEAYLVLWLFMALVLGPLLYFAICIMLRVLEWPARFLMARLGNVLGAFILFFICIIGHVLLFSLLVSVPFEKIGGYLLTEGKSMAVFVRDSMSVILLLALLSWIGWVRHLMKS